MPVAAKPLTIAALEMPSISARALSARMLRRETPAGPALSFSLPYAVLTPLRNTDRSVASTNLTGISSVRT